MATPATTTEQIAAAVTTQANVYFDGRCVSHTLILPDGTKKSVGVILPATLTFSTGAPERMECVAGECEVLLPGQTQWRRYGAGESFEVAGNASFQIRVADGGAYHYVCHFG